MSSAPDEAFDREAGSTEAEWRRALPGAVAPHALRLGAGRAEVALGGGTLALEWQPLPPRRLGRIALPRLAVRFRFRGVDAETRRRFMQRFDLHMHRGGG